MVVSDFARRSNLGRKEAELSQAAIRTIAALYYKAQPVNTAQTTAQAREIPTLKFQTDTLPDEEVFQNADCTGANCAIENEDAEDADGTMVGLQDLIDLTVELGSADVTLDSRDGFDTLVIASDLDVLDNILANAITVEPPSAEGLGFWGEHGFAGVAIGKGPLTGSLELADLDTTVPFEGRVNFAFRPQP